MAQGISERKSDLCVSECVHVCVCVYLHTSVWAIKTSLQLC